MTLSLVLSHPDLGVYSPPVVSGSLSYEIDRYPRTGFTAEIRPDPNGASLLQTPYGTVAQVVTRDGLLLFTGPVLDASTQRPDGAWRLTGQDPIAYLAAAKFSNRPDQFLPGDPMDVPSWITAVAAAVGVGSRIKVAGSGGTVDPRSLDVSGKDAWRVVEDALVANNLDVWVQGDGTLAVGPTATMKTVPDKRLMVGEQGTIVSYDLTMRRTYNTVVITHRARKQGQDDRYIDGVWQDDGAYSGVAAVGPSVLTQTVDVGEDWWDDPAAKQVQADANAAAAGQTMRGVAREVVIGAIPDYALKPGATVEVMYNPSKRDRILVTGVEFPMEPGPMRITGRNPDPDSPAATLIRRS